MSKVDNQRIAKNTVFLYFRMMLIMFVTLYTSRVTLKVLGIDNYGIYQTVGGVVTFLSFLSSLILRTGLWSRMCWSSSQLKKALRLRR